MLFMVSDCPVFIIAPPSLFLTLAFFKIKFLRVTLLPVILSIRTILFLELASSV